MANNKSKSLEIVCEGAADMAVGSIKGITFRVAKNGRNVASHKVKQPNKTGRPELMKNAPIKWATLREQQLCYWDKIAVEHGFWSRWQAFVSSFLKYADAYGIEQAMSHDLTFFDSTNRHQQKQYFENSLKRSRNYKADSQRLKLSKENYGKYPVDINLELIRPVLTDIVDINNALELKLLRRTDAVIEYEYFPEQEGDVEKGYYIRRKRARVGDEIFEPFQAL